MSQDTLRQKPHKKEEGKTAYQEVLFTKDFPTDVVKAFPRSFRPAENTTKTFTINSLWGALIIH